MKQNTLPLITSYFVIMGDMLNPQECTSFIGMSPTSYGIKGTKRKGGRPDVPFSFWKVSIEKKPCICIDDAINGILDLLQPHMNEILTFLKKPSITASLGSNITINDERPLYCLKPETIKKIAILNVEYSLDIFDYS